MKCPVCWELDLVMTDRQGIEIDYCPKCRGVWLDRGELDKIIERSAVQTIERSAAQAAAPPVSTDPVRDRETYQQRETYRDSAKRYRDDDDDDDDDDDYHDKKRRRKRGGFLSELFDFD